MGTTAAATAEADVSINKKDLVTALARHPASAQARAARRGRNPATGEAIKIKASKYVAFRATKRLKIAA
jgi:hypothetical protein